MHSLSWPWLVLVVAGSGLAACGSNGTRVVSGAGGLGGAAGAHAGTGGAAGGGGTAGAAGSAGAAGGHAGGGAAGAAGAGGGGGNAGAGGMSGAAGGAAGGMAGAAGGGGTAAGGAGGACDATCAAVAGSLSGLLWQLPCSDTGNPACATTPTTTVSAMMNGSTGTTYDVTLQFRGVVEQKTYTGGCSDGSTWLVGGADDGDTFNVYELDVSSPPQHLFLNRGASSINHCWVLNFQQTIRIDAGATVTLTAKSVDSMEIINVGTDGTTPLTVPGVSVQQPYNGQFIQMDVLSVATTGSRRAPPSELDSRRRLGLRPQHGRAGHDRRFGVAGADGQRDSGKLVPVLVDAERLCVVGRETVRHRYRRLVHHLVGEQRHQCRGWADQSVGRRVGSLDAGRQPVAPRRHDLRRHSHEDDLVRRRPTGLVRDGHRSADLRHAPGADWRGRRQRSGAGLLGRQLDEVRVFSTTRTADQVWSDVHTHALGHTAGLVGEWTFDDASAIPPWTAAAAATQARWGLRPARKPATRAGYVDGSALTDYTTSPILSPRMFLMIAKQISSPCAGALAKFSACDVSICPGMGGSLGRITASTSAASG